MPGGVAVAVAALGVPDGVGEGVGGGGTAVGVLVTVAVVVLVVVALLVTVLVTVGVVVGGAVPVAEAVGGATDVAVGVAVWVAVRVGAAVAVRVEVPVAVRVAVFSGVRVGACVAVAGGLVAVEVEVAGGFVAVALGALTVVGDFFGVAVGDEPAACAASPLLPKSANATASAKQTTVPMTGMAARRRPVLSPARTQRQLLCRQPGCPSCTAPPYPRAQPKRASREWADYSRLAGTGL